MNSELSRIHALVDDDGTSRLAEYTYLGADRTAQVDLAEPGVKFTWLRQSGDAASDDPYTGWDRFGRAVDLRWIKESSGAELERLEHGYDRASNRLYRKNRVAGGSAKQDELYAYDGLYQLKDFQRGELNSGHTGMTGTLAAQEQLAFDPTGNWNSYVVDSGTPQTRTHNKANELTALNSSSALVGEDLAGNMTRVPQPGSGSAGYDLKYDAWNRLVAVKDGGTTVALYGYDGLNRRITKTVGSATRHFYYTDKWQIIEERLNTSSTADRQFVWGLRYIDDLILRDRGTERLYVVQDYFQPTAVLNTSGVVLERYGYKAFGTARVMDASFVTQTSSSYEWETRFGAYRWDHETGLSQVRNRYLHPALGRWVTRDPIGYRGGSNLYAYVANNPVSTVDFLGLDAVPVPPGGFPTGPRDPCPCGEIAAQIGGIGPIDANTASRLANEARAATRASRLPGAGNGQADAFRHCFWSCRMAQEIGADQAKKVGDTHERCTKNNPPSEEAMDQANNATGRGFGTPGADCNAQCLQAVRDGTLQNSPGGTPPANPY